MMQDAPHPTPDRRLMGAYAGSTDTLAPLAIRTSILTFLTLGLYRFWERTRIRRYIWSATAPGGDPFEYTGTGLEKLMGFLVALVILAVGLGVFQIALMFAGLSVFTPTEGAEMSTATLLLWNAPVLLLVPLGFFARYRARRYRLGRTRWRGIRFGVLPGAAGYAWRGTVLLALTVASLGLLWPLMTFSLAKYRTDRTVFGDARFRQGGRWPMLYRAMGHLFVSIGLIVSGILLMGTGAGGVLLLVAGIVWLPFGVLAYRVGCYRILTENCTAGAVSFGTDIAPGVVMKRLLKGLLIVFLLGLLVSGLFAGIVASSGLMNVVIVTTETGTMPQPTLFQSVLSLLGALLSLQMYGVLYLLFIQQPILSLVVSRTWVDDPLPLTAIRQRNQDDFADADGFADALDVGGTF